MDRSDRAGPRERDLPQSPLGPLFGDGFLGRAVGGMVASAVKSLGEQMAQQARETRGVFEDAAAAIRASPDVAARMGGAVVVGDPISQSSSSSSINGRVTKRVVLVSGRGTCLERRVGLGDVRWVGRWGVPCLGGRGDPLCSVLLPAVCPSPALTLSLGIR